MAERYLVIKQKLNVRFYKITKNQRPITTVKNRIFRTDEKLMIPDRDGKYEFCMYDIDGTQPYNGIAKFLDPDETKIYLSFLKMNSAKPINVNGVLDGIFNKVVLGVVALVVLWAVGSMLLNGGIF